MGELVACGAERVAGGVDEVERYAVVVIARLNSAEGPRNLLIIIMRQVI